MTKTPDPYNQNAPVAAADGLASEFFVQQWNKLLAYVQLSTTAANSLLAQVNSILAQVKALLATGISTTLPITGGGTLGAPKAIGHADSGVAAGSYTSANITVDGKGHVTAAANGSGAGARGALITRTSIQTIPSNTDVIISYDTTNYDDASFTNLASNPTRITIPSGVSLVCIVAFVEWNGVGANEHYVNIKKNGSFAYSGQGQVSAGSMASGVLRMEATTGFIKVTAGDYFELDVYRTAGAGDISAGAWFSIVALA